ncbi:restriction endonuclease subunit S [Muricauda sp. SCSIO 64092]|uniref:restriction endonuclease subunit S n=1 Tax=Allomuricauda sp. SCSIO 64092 TaxID=2908842 RepID=UPI001FF21777|nr:restriction endonuclease subunit S [Muricauda sp. SCSIO 64092]UOY05740.1 restriction endonuclease subunit S [Muricauda sp. SCSIO 64092]
MSLIPKEQYLLNILDKMPKHWRYVQLRYLLKGGKDGIRNGISGKTIRSNQKKNDDYLKVYSQVNVLKNDFGITDKWIEKTCSKKLKKYEVEPGDLLMNIVAYDPIIRKVPQNIDRGIFGNNILRIRLNQKLILTEFFEKTINHSRLLKYQLESGSRGSIIQGLNSETIKSLIVPVPPINEQIKILYHLTKNIESYECLITKKKRLVSLQYEKIRTLIYMSFQETYKQNKGFEQRKNICNQNQSKTWNLIRLGYLFKTIRVGITPNTKSTKYYENGNIPWITAGDLNDDWIKGSMKKITKMALNDYPELRLYPKNSLVIGLTGTTIGKVGILSVESCISQSCCVIAESDKVDIEYIFYWMKTQRDYLTNLSRGGSLLNITKEIIKNLKVPLPHLEEQRRITFLLNFENKKNERHIFLLRKQIELLEEYSREMNNEILSYGRLDRRL